MLQRSLEPTVEAPSEARATLAELDPPLSEEMGERARLLVSELVTNALRHATGSVIELEFDLVEGGLEVTVTDRGRGFDLREQRLGHPDVGGWGLILVDTLAEAWSSGHGEDAWVWFRLESR